MVKILAVLFAALLAYAHLADVQGRAYDRPLSMFRDYNPEWVGYALFGLLLAIGAETIRTALRLRAEYHAAVYLATTSLLAVVVATDSRGELHNGCALAAMLIMFGYYAVLLYRSDCLFWLFFHFLVPSIVLIASKYESYGIWQKGMILYFLAAAVVHQDLLAQWLPKRKQARFEKVRIQVGRLSSKALSADESAVE